MRLGAFQNLGGREIEEEEKPAKKTLRKSEQKVRRQTKTVRYQAGGNDQLSPMWLIELSK